MVKTTMFDGLLAQFAPHSCSGCGFLGTILCYSCKNNITSEIWANCVLCERPCGQSGMCRKCVGTVPFEQIWAIGQRRGELEKLIDEYKFSSKRETASVIAELLHYRLPVIPSDTVIVGIPASSHAKRVRGFDHMELIVKSFAQIRNLTIANPLVRIFDQELHTMGRKQRIALKDELFALSGRVVPSKILLVDDILTTGTTMSSAANLLRNSGASCIYGAVVARQPFDK
ncbi:ComF family protein [Candidatus Saccharibacteria bacterium]|nr:ComF family protein [Candidatus Saccharibacteria bacterium]